MHLRTMLFNINTLSWDNYLLDLFDIPESILPDVCNSDASFGVYLISTKSI